MNKSNLLIFIGGIMLFNPVITIYDILPDALGFLLIAIGLFPYSKVEMALDDARRNAFYMLAIGTVKLALTPVIFMSNYADDKLLATAGFAVVECIFGTLFMKNFFSGMTYLADRHGDGTLSERYSEDTFFIKLFFQLRIWLPLIPELTALAADKAHNDDAHYEDLMTLYEMKNILVVFVTAVGLIVGVIYLIKIINIFSASRADKSCSDFVSDEFESKYVRSASLRTDRRVRAAHIVLVTAAACFADVIIDDAPVLVPAYGMLLAALALTVMGGFKKHGISILLVLLCSAADFASEILKINAVDSGIIDILQITPQVVIVGVLISLLSAAAWIIFAITFSKAYLQLRQSLTDSKIPFGALYVYGGMMLFVRCLGCILPNLRMWLPTVYAIIAILFVVTAWNRFFRPYREE